MIRKKDEENIEKIYISDKSNKKADELNTVEPIGKLLEKRPLDQISLPTEEPKESTREEKADELNTVEPIEKSSEKRPFDKISLPTAETEENDNKKSRKMSELSNDADTHTDATTTAKPKRGKNLRFKRKKRTRLEGDLEVIHQKRTANYIQYNRKAKKFRISTSRVPVVVDNTNKDKHQYHDLEDGFFMQGVNKVQDEQKKKIIHEYLDDVKNNQKDLWCQLRDMRELRSVIQSYYRERFKEYALLYMDFTNLKYDAKNNEFIGHIKDRISGEVLATSPVTEQWIKENGYYAHARIIREDPSHIISLRAGRSKNQIKLNNFNCNMPSITHHQGKKNRCYEYSIFSVLTHISQFFQACGPHRNYLIVENTVETLKNDWQQYHNCDGRIEKFFNKKMNGLKWRVRCWKINQQNNVLYQELERKLRDKDRRIAFYIANIVAMNGDCNHWIGIYDGMIFDVNFQKTRQYSKAALDSSCSSTTCKTKFKEFGNIIEYSRLFPKGKKK